MQLNNSADSPRRREKTNCRPPFSILEPGRLGVRDVPRSRAGNQETMRLVAERAADTRESCVGQAHGIVDCLSEILHLGTKYGLAGRISGAA